jgi:hypothetical protein
VSTDRSGHGRSLPRIGPVPATLARESRFGETPGSGDSTLRSTVDAAQRPPSQIRAPVGQLRWMTMARIG